MEIFNTFDYCTELSEDELVEIEGGFVPLLIAGVALLLAGCSNSQTNSGINMGTQVNVNVKCDSCKSITVIVNGDSTTVHRK